MPNDLSSVFDSTRLKVAIITPYYNTGAIFHETAASVFAQTWQDWEWVIINDGSNDAEAIHIIASYRKSDPRIKVIDQPNKGLPTARNVGVAASTAPLLFFLDSDDILAPTALEHLITLLAQFPSVGFATTWVQAFGARSFVWKHGFTSGNYFLFENTVTPLSIVRRTVFDTIGGFNELRIQGLEDYEFWIQCAAQGYWGIDVCEVLVFQRHKTPNQYVHYQWANRDDPTKLRAFQDEMRRTYPKLYREGVPHLHATGKSAHAYACERVGLWAFPLTRWLLTKKYQLTSSSFWHTLGPWWRRVKGALL